jgi:hypothetical protein
MFEIKEPETSLKMTCSESQLAELVNQSNHDLCFSSHSKYRKVTNQLGIMKAETPIFVSLRYL